VQQRRSETLADLGKTAHGETVDGHGRFRLAFRQVDLVIGGAIDNQARTVALHERFELRLDCDIEVTAVERENGVAAPL
jgi:hypothetical protein